jgi:RimJ/RimL family protein N-acetyltransferase
VSRSIETLWIRPCQLSDADAVMESVRESSREIFPWLPWCHPEYSRSDAEQWLQGQFEAWAERREFGFSIVEEDGTFLGACAINQINWAHRFGNIGYWVRTGATRRGVATAAVARLVEFARTETDLVRLEIVVAVGNTASARVAVKSGAVLEGTLRSRLFMHGKPHDALMHAIVISR